VIRNIIFDWSGTLVDDLPAVWQATNDVLKLARCPAMSLEEFRAEFCLPFSIFYDKHIPHIPMPQLEEWFHGSYKKIQDSVSALPHAREFLEFCRSNRMRIFVLSSVHPDHFQAQLRASGFGEFVEQAYVGVWDKRQKIGQILEENSLRPAETLFVGDMQHDIETARHGGIHSCAVLTGYSTLTQLRRADPELIVEHLGELGGLLRQNGLYLKLEDGGKPEDGRPPVVTVGALILNRAGRVLMVRTHKWSDLWGIPGGKVRWGEPSEDALRRELKEETNLDVDDVKFVMVQDCIGSKEFYRDAHFVLLNYTCRYKGREEVVLNEEAREFRWLSPAAALKLPLNTPTRRLLEEVLARKKRRRKS